ncbi:hypothetical protein DB354_16740 [Opitutus sp. ER46]|nr:hypothetical protein DB354_16740 [Opitutus sp. ER46]
MALASDLAWAAAAWAEEVAGRAAVAASTPAIRTRQGKGFMALGDGFAWRPDAAKRGGGEKGAVTKVVT